MNAIDDHVTVLLMFLNEEQIEWINHFPIPIMVKVLHCLHVRPEASAREVNH
jgi:hypothetical protein